MKISMESTERIISISGLRCRVWRGETAGGVRCWVFVPTVAVHESFSQDEFERELAEAEHLPATAVDARLLS